MGRKDMMRTTMIAAVCAAIGTAGGIAGVSAATNGNDSSGSSGSSTAPDRDPGQGRDPSQGGHIGQNGVKEELLTGDVAAKVRQAALDKVGGGTVERVETDADHGSPYEAHIRRSDGTELEVLVNKDFSVTAVNQMGPH
ncbi:MAG: hypothetical protein ABW142_11145 [Thermoleophilaceae bacterium]